MNQPCRHRNLQVISQDENGKFLECLDCKEIFESGEVEESEPKEDLSDA
ncbi:MAG TPA: hypothetical protein VNN17_05210 [Terriglobia bacterium]|nr:hypothetical protein [Terriglobia bacterium]